MDENSKVLDETFSLTNFPKEMVEKILLNNSYEEVVIFSTTCSSFRDLSWSFWKEKARLDLEIPDWYFDLYCNGRDAYINREISGHNRYLELKIAKDPLPNQKFARKEDRLTVEKAFFFSFFSGDREGILNKARDLSDDILEAYIDYVPSNNIFDPYDYRRLFESEMSKRKGIEKEEFSLEKTLRARNNTTGLLTIEDFNEDRKRIASIIDYLDDKCDEIVRDGNYEDFFQLIYGIENYGEDIINMTMKVKAVISIFRNLRDPFDLAFQFFELFRKKSEDPVLALTIICQIISTGRLDKLDDFSLILKKKDVQLLDTADSELFFGHPSGTRTYAEIFSLFAYYSNSPEMIERFSNHEDYSGNEGFDYKPLSKNYQILYLLFGFLKKRNIVNFYRVLSLEDMIWNRQIQILVTISGHREAILYMIKNVPIEKNFPALLRMIMGDPSVEEILLEHFDFTKPNLNFMNEFSMCSKDTFFIENLIDRTCCTNYVEKKLGLDQDCVLEFVKQLEACFKTPQTPQ